MKASECYSFIILTGVFLGGCAVSTEESIRQAKQESAAYAGYDPANYWAPAETIELCFFGPESSATSRQALADGVEEQDWGGLSVNANNQCGNSPSNDSITVYLTDPALSVGPYTGWATGTKGGRISSPNIVDDLSGGTIDIAPNYDNRTDVQIWMEWKPWSPESSIRTLVHEVAHAIGIAHEHERNDAPDCPSDPEHKNMLLLTELDPVSIMSYCATSYGRDPMDYNLSRLDELGIEMLYPREGFLPFACADGCMNSGGGVILRGDGSARDSWSARGALDWWDSNGIRWTSELMQNPFALGEQLEASWMPTDSDDVFYWSISRFTGEQIIGEGHVEVSDAKWTAVAMAVL